MSNQQQALCMLGGSGQTSYANNSIFQRSIISKVRPLLEESIRTVTSNTSTKCLNTADLGCSSGPNTLSIVRSFIDGIVLTSKRLNLQIPEINVFMNDLPHNDFNSIFNSLPSFHRKLKEDKGVDIPCFIFGTPGSFYGRLFPADFINIVHSSSSLHWISQAPKEVMGKDGKEALNKGSIYATKASPPRVLKAYRQQFAKDFSMFLSCRSKEAVEGGRIVLSFGLTHDDEPCPLLELPSLALYKLASLGEIDKKKLDDFNLPYYRPSVEQVKQLIEAEGSLAIQRLDTYTVSVRDEIEREIPRQDPNALLLMLAESVTRSIRAFIESLLASVFGEEIMDTVFQVVQDMVINELACGQQMEILIIAVSLVKGSCSPSTVVTK